MALTPGAWPPISAVLSPSLPLDQGFRQMYNLDFDGAHRTFHEYANLHPKDPLGPSSDAAAYLFEELDRLGILQSELFVDNDNFNNRKKPSPDPVRRKNFSKAIAKSQELADAILKRSPNDRNALFATVLNQGLESDYLALVEKRDLASISYMKRAGRTAEKLLAVDPTCHDAYLAIGVENYILGLKPAPIRWLLKIYGAQTDRTLGIEKLELTAEKGHYLLPFARLLLSVAALRDKNHDRARELLQDLAREFPNNRLYRRELSRLQ